MSIVITAAEERRAADFRRQCEIVWWRVHAVARDADRSHELLLRPIWAGPVAALRDSIALAASDAGASREAIACILSVQVPDVGPMMARAEAARRAPRCVSTLPGVRLIHGGRG